MAQTSKFRTPPTEVCEAERRLAVRAECDVLVVGGGPAGKVIAGLCQELVNRLDARGAAVYPKKEE